MSDTTKPDKGTGIDWSEEEEWPWQADELPDDKCSSGAQWDS
jgi:hypothetical protein